MTNKTVSALDKFSFGRATSLAVRDLEVIEYYPTYLKIKAAAEQGDDSLIEDLFLYWEYSELSTEDLLANINKEASDIWDAGACLMGHLGRGIIKMVQLGELPSNMPDVNLSLALEKAAL